LTKYKEKYLKPYEWLVSSVNNGYVPTRQIRDAKLEINHFENICAPDCITLFHSVPSEQVQK